jgi:hypothetical protein
VLYDPATRREIARWDGRLVNLGQLVFTPPAWADATHVALAMESGSDAKLVVLDVSGPLTAWAAAKR